MKQSTKLLSFVLAILVAFSCLSVIGSAALDKNAIAYDGIDDAALTYDQVATLALDLVDNDLLSGMDTIDLSIVGTLRLNKIDYILADIHSLRNGLVWTIGKGLLGDIGDLDFSGLTVDDADSTALQRSNGDYKVISGLLLFLSENAGTLSKLAYGLDGGDGISLGLVSMFLDLGEVGDMLSNIPAMLVEMVFDMLVYGSYGYDMDIEEIKDKGSTLTATYPEMDTLDEMLPNVLYNLLTNPQDYTWEGEGEAAVKVWDMDSVIMPDLALSAADINPLSNSLFGLLDKVAQVAIDEIAVPALNNNLKKTLMEAVEADLNEIDYETLPAAVKTYFDDTGAYETYFAYDRMKKDGGTWYYTTLETIVVEDPVTGEPEIDEEGNEVSKKVRKYFKINFGAANEFGNLINWDWEFVTSDVTPAAGQTALVYDDILAAGDGTIVGALNYILGLVYDVALTTEAKADYVAKAQLIDPDVTGWVNNDGNGDLMTNVEYLTKYILTEFGDRIFGSTSPYAAYTWEDVQDLSILDLVAMIGPGFFEDAMPQIILPKNADGTYAFHEGMQLWEFAAVVLRELITGIAPQVNYDAYIFENGDVTSADDRLFVEADADYWFNLILNMGTDLALVYLQQITNFNDFCLEQFGADFSLDGYVTNAVAGVDETHWQTSLNYAILWAVNYIGGQRSTGVLDGITYNAVLAIEHPFDRLSFILNKLLPLGFVGNGELTSSSYDLDLALVVDYIKEFLSTCDISIILKLFGRNQESSYNAFDDASLGTAVLDLVNDILSLVFGTTILQNVNATTSVSTQSLTNVVSQVALKTTIQNLFGGLNARKDAILMNALPVVGKLISGWGTEQEFQNPVNDMGTFIDVDDDGISHWYETTEDCGTTTYTLQKLEPITVTVRNGSDGMWRHYVDANGTEHQDEHYKIQLASVEFFNVDGSATSYINDISVDTKVVDYGDSTTFSFQYGSITTPDNQVAGAGCVAIPDEGVVQRVKIGYKIYVENGEPILNGKVFYDESFVFFSRYATDERTNYETSSDAYGAHVYSPIYVPYYEDDLQATLDYIKDASIGQFDRSNVFLTGGTEDYSITVASSPDTDGLTLSSVSARIPNGDHDSVMIRLFDTYTAEVMMSGAVSTTFAVNGAVPTVDTFANNVKVTEVDSVTGASSSWTVNMVAKADKNEMDGAPVVLKYYNAEYRDLLLDLVADENSAQRKAEDYKHYYNANATVEAFDALINVDVPASESESGEFELRETNFAVGSNGVTVINCAQAWSTYQAALKDALYVALQEWNPKSKFNFREVYNALRVAVNDLEYCVATVDDGAANLGTTIDALEDALRASEARQTDKYNHTDYKMYRHNRYNDARDDIKGYIALKDEASPATVAAIDEYFEYSWMEENVFRALVGAHNVKYGEHAGEAVAANEYQTYLLALLEQYNEEEIEGKKQWLSDRKKAYAGVAELDLAMASNYLTLTEDRLLRRAYIGENGAGVITAQLEDEIASAQNMIGTTNGGRYTDGSWANYIEAYNDAVAAVSSGSQKQVFDAKYKLLVERKELVLVENAGDYAELNALIANAQFALDNPELYDNTAKEIGQVLAELGMDPIVNEDGYEVQLFPGSALITVESAYGVDDQNKIDDAAWVLKEALARLKFKGLQVKDTVTKEIVDSEVLVADDDKTEDVNEEISALVSHIAKETTEADAKALFEVVATNLTGVTVDDVIVTNDVNYSVSYDGMDEFIGFAGTNSTITFYTTYNGVKLPVATVKVVVDGDINGDGAIDVLDASYAALVEQEKGELAGCYLLAGDLTGGDRALTANDYAALVNLAIA